MWIPGGCFNHFPGLLIRQSTESSVCWPFRFFAKKSDVSIEGFKTLSQRNAFPFRIWALEAGGGDRNVGVWE
jgi:hypothetical protein